MHITIVDDEKVLGNKIKKKLEHEGFAVSHFDGYYDFMNHGDSQSQLYIVDISLGDGSGYDVIHWLREKVHCHSPIMILSGYRENEKLVHGLNIGADDYLMKPFVPDEFSARIKALLRRPHHFSPQKILSHRCISLDPGNMEAKIGDNRLSLTHKESMILELFLTHQSEIISRERLITNIWGGHHVSDVSDNTINVTLSNLRKKLGEDFSLKVHYNVGYILE